MPCKNECAINDSLTPHGVENIVIFAVSEIQLILTLNGKLALIGY